MNFFFPLIASIVVCTLVFLYLALNIRTKSYNKSKTKPLNPPEAPGAWPIIGHLHKLIGGGQLLHHKLGAMADECGHFFTFRQGTRRIFVVSSLEVAKECFTVRDKALASRPETSVTKHMANNNTLFGLAPYDPFWRDMRKICTIELLSASRLELLKHVRLTEIDTSIMELYNSLMIKKNQHIVDLQHWFTVLTLNVIVKMVAGKRYPSGDDDEARRLARAVDEFFLLAAISNVTDELPSAIRWLDLLGYKRAMKKTEKTLDCIVEGWLEEHKSKKMNNSGDQKIKAGNPKDFMDVMLSLKENGDLSHFRCRPDTAIKSTCTNMILGANDTTTTAMIWTIAHLLNNRHALTKIQEELDVHVGVDRIVNESDIPNLSYLRAALKESMRLNPVASLLVPRQTLEDCTIAGFNVPCGSSVYFNAWKIQRDPKVWKNPTMFLPERFLTTHAHVELTSIYNSEIIAFGGGRRSCPGILFATQIMHLTLARLIQAFEITTPFDEPVDMTEGDGISTSKATPLKVVLTPRLPAQLYCLQ